MDAKAKENAEAETSGIAERLRAALKPRPFATAASAAAPTARTSAPLWAWAPNADGGMPPPVPESYDAVPDAPKPFRLGDRSQDPYAPFAVGVGACEPDHNFSWKEFAPGEGEKAQMLEKATDAAAFARAIALIAKIGKAAAATAKAATATAKA